MAKYTIYLEEGMKSQILLETDDYHKADEFLYQKWHEIEGKQVLLLVGEGGLRCTRYAVKGNPLSDWEAKRMDYMRNLDRDIVRNGDVTLIVRGLLEEFEEGQRKYVRIAS